jgi:hypothetical protein
MKTKPKPKTMRRRRFWSFFILLSNTSALCLAAGVEGFQEKSHDFLPSSSFLECDLYIAESTIPNAGLGIFTAVEKKVGDMVGNGDVCFPLLEMDWHNGKILEKKEYYDPFEDYVW